MLPDLCVGKRMCCLKPNATTAYLKLAASSSFGLLMCKLKSLVMTMLGFSTMLSVSHSVNSAKSLQWNLMEMCTPQLCLG